MEILGLAFLASLVAWYWHHRPIKFDDEWRHVPPPSWAAKRGWRDTW